VKEKSRPGDKAGKGFAFRSDHKRIGISTYRRVAAVFRPANRQPAIGRLAIAYRRWMPR